MERIRTMATRDGKIIICGPTEGDRCYNWGEDGECDQDSWGGIGRYLPECHAISVYGEGYRGYKGNRRHSTRDPPEKGRECPRRRDLVESYRRMGEPIEWGGDCPIIKVYIRTLEVPKDASNEDWARAIAGAAEGRRVIYSDGSKSEGVEGMVGGGWLESDDVRGGVAVGGRATV